MEYKHTDEDYNEGYERGRDYDDDDEVEQYKADKEFLDYGNTLTDALYHAHGRPRY